MPNYGSYQTPKLPVNLSNIKKIKPFKVDNWNWIKILNKSQFIYEY